jgi:hypothetical protein
VGATERIIERLVPEWIEHQRLKAKDYNSRKELDDFGIGLPQEFENADVLGIPGQFAEIWRKIWKLKKGMWDGVTLVNEPVREILLDLIGHAFLAIDMIDRKTGPIQESQSALTVLACGPECHPRNHRFVGDCRYRYA